MASDRILGLVVVCVALAYIASAVQIQTSFLSDPVGSKTFPIIIGSVAAICGAMLVLRPDEDPDWPALRTFGALAVTVIVLVIYAYSLRPLGFLLPTAVASGVLSYQISERVRFAAFTGIGLSLVLFFVFKYALGLGLVALPKAITG
ncbi:MAG: tripartite tricarboxylate transporter TctB family protein [Paracoccaceae bacterium]